jgi:triacylglycerol lipase
MQHGTGFLVGVLSLCLAASATASPTTSATAPPDCGAAATTDCRPVAVLLHGLARSSSSMRDMAGALEEGGWRVCNIDYPSTTQDIPTLVAQQIRPQLQACVGADPRPVAFVTHSLGGILVRQLHADDPAFAFGRVVMLGPPNGGSEVVDELGDFAPFGWINGPAGLQLGTDADSVPRALGATDLDVGVVAGENSINVILSQMIPGDDDGKVSLESARLEGMRDFLVVPVSHPFLMQDDVVIAQTLHYLREGGFDHTPPPPATPNEVLSK